MAHAADSETAEVLALRECPLVYYPDDRPGISRRRCGRGFTYVDPDGTRIDDEGERQRLAAVGVPPAYEKVWICPRPDGHLQATGRDARSRKQYRYHPDWTEWRSRRKFQHLETFGLALPRLRRRIARDLDGEAGEREFALAAVVALLDRTAIRIGHPENVAEYGTHGATTLRRQHVRLGEGEILLDYRAKGGKRVRRRLRDKRLHRVLHALDDLPGRELIEWVDMRGEPHRVSSEAVNEYIAEVVGEVEATAKAFRTWAGTVAAFEVALSTEAPTIKRMAEAAAERLANTPTIARNSYIHPAVIDLAGIAGEEQRRLAEREPPIGGLRRAEGLLLAHLAERTEEAGT